MDVLDHPPEKPLVDINRATYEELLNVKGIGPSSAARILYARQERGRFATVQELRRIKGFSKRMFERARPFLVAGPP
jgi:competence protein ComEA